MSPTQRGRVVVLAGLLSGCCYLGTPAPAPPTPPIVVEAPIPLPTAEPLPPALSSGVARHLCGRQLLFDVPASSVAASRTMTEDGFDRWVGDEAVVLETEEVGLRCRDLPCAARAGDDFGAQVHAEIARRWPELPPPWSVRAVPSADPALSVVEVIPGPLSEDLEHQVAYFAIDLGDHVVLITGSYRSESFGREPARDRAARRAAEAMVASVRRGPWRWGARVPRRVYGDLFNEITAPEGWVYRKAGCCNEEEPYVTRWRETVMPLRTLGAAPRARVTARWGVCPPGVPERESSMFGTPMRWQRTRTGLCWQEVAPDGDAELGVSWHLRGATDADLDEAVHVASTAAHSSR